MEYMKSYLIKDTTFEERLEIVRAFEETGSCENTGMDQIGRASCRERG